MLVTVTFSPPMLTSTGNAAASTVHSAVLAAEATDSDVAVVVALAAVVLFSAS